MRESAGLCWEHLRAAAECSGPEPDDDHVRGAGNLMNENIEFPDRIFGVEFYFVVRDFLYVCLLVGWTRATDSGDQTMRTAGFMVKLLH